MAGDEPKQKGEGVGGGFVAGEQQGEGFVADLAVVHRAGFVRGFEHHAEEIVAGDSGGAALADHGEDHAIEGGEGAAHGGDGADGQALKQAGSGQEREGQIVVEDGHGVDDGLDGGVDVGAEQAAADDAEGELDHGGVELDGPARAPGGGGLAGECDDLGSVAGDAVAVEGGGDEAALTKVEGFLAGEEAVAEDAAGALEDDAAAVVRGVADEDVGDGVGVVELELAVAARGEEAADIAVDAGVFAVEGRRVNGEQGAVEEAVEDAWAGGPGWLGVSHGVRFGHLLSDVADSPWG